MSTSESSPEIKALTGLRAIAAIMVVLAHARHALPDSTPRFILHYLSWGLIPVVFFFLLSGFILSTVYQSRLEKSGYSKDAKQKYLWARAARLLPVYYFAALIALAYPFVTGQFLNQMPGEAMSWAGLLTVTVGFTKHISIPYNGPAWSLTCEFIFYLLFPIILPFITRLSNRAIKQWFWGLVIFNFALQAALKSYELTLPENQAIWFEGVASHFPFFHLPTFAVGILTSQMLKKDLMPSWAKSRSSLIFIVIGTISILFALIPSPVAYQTTVSAILLPMFALLLVAATDTKGFIVKILSSPLFLFGGAASYSLYITHWPIRDFVQFYVLNGQVSRPVGALMALIAIFGVAILAYKLIEVPAQKGMIQWWNKRSASRQSAASVAKDREIPTSD